MEWSLLFTSDVKKLIRLAPTLKRVLIVDPNPTAAKLLAELVKGMGARDVTIRLSGPHGLESCRDFEPTIIFTEQHGRDLDGEAFSRAVRRSHLACRQAPIIMVANEATAAAILGARDSGVHEFLRKPFTNGDLMRRVEVVALKPRNWIEAVGYVGPDRRRFNSGEYSGPRKRKADDAATGVEAAFAARDQAMRILASAMKQFDSDPAQALRAMNRQADILKGLADQGADAALAAAVSGLKGELGSTPTRRCLVRPVQMVLAQAAPETLMALAA